ncbi:MAG TPA: M20/M25/M40 family metallo-hydrolase, partial [Pseudonocardiaceae bacterium]|nr:M20/M25/M40 family metallo-hydrolase [Pseudonocardiaceae bacterium]
MHTPSPQKAGLHTAFRRRRLSRPSVAALGCSALVLTATATGASAAPGAESAQVAPTPAAQLTHDVSVDGVERHLHALQRIADDNGGTRAVTTSGFDASVDYVAGTLRDAGFDVSTPEFDYQAEILDVAGLEVGGRAIPIKPMTFTPSTPAGGVTGPLLVVPGDGCEAADYAGLTATGAVAMIRRGTCTFTQKQQVAADAGAIAAVIANNVPGPLDGTLGDAAAARIPTGGISQADGDGLLGSGGAPARVELQVRREDRVGRNVIAQTRTGRPDNVVMAGAHLDSVEEGPGINDNGSGTGALVEMAEEIAQLKGKPRNRIRFAFWGAEESGLVGSTAYVADLIESGEIDDIEANLNFDMLASPNFVRFVYDGDNSTGEGDVGPPGSAEIEQVFLRYFALQGLEVEPTAFDGRSDYGPFIAPEALVPAGGL